ncbi:MAG: alginate O-acetyltransferase AlgX-related protein [Bacteroidales bacterium]
MRTVKHILFGFLMAMLFVPMLQNLTNLFSEKPLQGAFDLLQKPQPIRDSIFSGSYMYRMNDYTEQNIGFRPTLVRINNQLDYCLYKLPHAEGIVIGKEGQLFEEDYITEYLGRNFIGKNTIARKVKCLKFLQDYLKKEKNIDLIVILSPSKVRFYPEDIPNRFKPDRKSLSNYQCFIDNFNSSGLKYINFSSWFAKIKNESKYPLYPLTGVHWSDYASTLAADSLIHYVEAVRNCDLPDMVTRQINLADTASSADLDVWRTMNLLWHIPQPHLAYPVIEFRDGAGKTRPRLLTIADSYYWNWTSFDIPLNVFSNQAFWIYNRQVYTNDVKGTQFTDQLNLKDEVEKRDVILLMVTERFLYTAFWNFTEDLYKIYNPKVSAEDIVMEYGGKIRRNRDWFMDEIRKAGIMHLSLEAMINMDAAYVYGEEFKKKTNPTREDTLLLYEIRIWADSTRLANSTKKAKEMNYNLSEMVRNAAVEQYQSENRGSAILNPAEVQTKINEIEQQIRSDKSWLTLVKKKAKERKISLKEMIHIDAEWTYEQNNKK